MPKNQRGNMVQNLVSGGVGAFIEAGIGGFILLALFGLGTDMTFIDTNGSFFTELQSSLQDGMLAMVSIVVLIVLLIALGVLRRRGII